MVSSHFFTAQVKHAQYFLLIVVNFNVQYIFYRVRVNLCFVSSKVVDTNSPTVLV